jgi:hypothetical protein
MSQKKVLEAEIVTDPNRAFEHPAPARKTPRIANGTGLFKYQIGSIPSVQHRTDVMRSGKISRGIPAEGA